MNFDEYKERLIVEGLASVHKHEKRPERIRGGVMGFELCRTLNSVWDFQDELERRHRHEVDLISLRSLSEERRAELAGADVPVSQGPSRGTIEDYWEYRIATAQVEYVYERMLVVWAQAER